MSQLFCHSVFGVNLDDVEWHRRHAKRSNVLQSLLSSSEYKLVQHECEDDWVQNMKPDPGNRALSKRDWEDKMMKYRNAVLEEHSKQAILKELGLYLTRSVLRTPQDVYFLYASVYYISH